MIAIPNPEITGSTGATDNAILRADGTGGSAAQTSGLVVDDAVVSYNVTGDAATDIITAVGHIYTTNQPVVFTALTGGAGLSANTLYFVRNISGNTFQVSTTSGGAAVNFTTNITAGSVIAIQTNVAISQNTSAADSSLVLTPKGTGALIAGPKPDRTGIGGNPRGAYAIDLQTSIRTSAAQVASGSYSLICGGQNNTASGSYSAVNGGINNVSSNTATIVAGGLNNTASGANGMILGGDGNQATGFGTVAIGWDGNTASGAGALAFGSRAVADRSGMLSHANFRFAVNGDAQRARFVMRNKTTTNSAVELFLDGSATRLTIPSGKIIALTINIAGVSSTGAAVAHYMRQYALKNVAGTTAEVYAPITVGTDNAAGTSIALSASDASDALIVNVTGTASTIWRWVASVDAVEIAYGT